MTFLPVARPCLALAVLLLSPAAGAAGDDFDDGQLWMAASASGRISGDLTGAFDTNVRATDSASHFGHFQVRGMLGWQVSETFMAGGGYTYVWTRSPAGRVVNEHRLFQQASFRIFAWDGGEIVGRTRLEQRTFDNADGTSWRLRQQVRANIPLRGPDGLRGIFHSELLINLNEPDDNTASGINQMRTFAGLGIPLFGETSLEAGYMNQTVFPGANRTIHILNLGLVTRF